MIGIFDSGYGGLTIMNGITKKLPQYDYLYLGDNGRYPYGNRSKETVIKFTEQAVEHLFKAGCQLVIIACFTASSQALREVQEKYLRNPKSLYKDRKILGVLSPVVEKAATVSKKNRIGVVATRGTVASNSFETELQKLKPGVSVLQQACPLLVPLIEEHWHEKPEAKMILKKYLRPLKTKQPDTLILGCTHYSYLAKDFKRLMGKNVEVVDPPEVVAQSLVQYLARHPEIEKQLTKDGKRLFETTDSTEKFQSFWIKSFGAKVADCKKVNL